MKHSETHPHQQKFFGPSPVEKIQFLAWAANHRELSRADLAILITLTDMVSSKTGVAWPSFKTLARRSGCSDRHAKTSVKGLVELNLLRIVSHGNKIRSNRYALNPSIQHLDTSESSELDNTTIVISSEHSGDAQKSLDVIHRSPQPIHESVHKARDEMNGWDDGEASPYGAQGPSGSPQPGKDRYPEFWSTYPLRAGVAEAEQLLHELISKGYDYNEIIEGAHRYAIYVNATNSHKRSTAPDWLRAERWRDSWSPPSRKGETTQKKKPYSISEKTVRSLSQDDLYELEAKLENELKSHIQAKDEILCEQCYEAHEEDSNELQAEMYCPVGLEIFKPYLLVCDRLNLLEKKQYKK